MEGTKYVHTGETEVSTGRTAVENWKLESLDSTLTDKEQDLAEAGQTLPARYIRYPFCKFSMALLL